MVFSKRANSDHVASTETGNHALVLVVPEHSHGV
jgi:hypothetical protein